MADMGYIGNSPIAGEYLTDARGAGAPRKSAE